MKARQEVAVFVLSGTTGSRPFTSRPGATRQGGRPYAQDRAHWAHRTDWHDNLVPRTRAQRGCLRTDGVHPLRRPCADANAHANAHADPADARTDHAGPDANAVGPGAGHAGEWRTAASCAPAGDEYAGADARVG